MPAVTRRSLLKLAGLGTAAGTAVLGTRAAVAKATAPERRARGSRTTPCSTRLTPWGRSGGSPTDRFDPAVFLRTWNFSQLRAGRARALLPRDAAARRHAAARVRAPTPSIARSRSRPGIFFPAWTFNGQVPGPTMRATEGDRVRVTFLNQGSHPHTIHFHGWHPPEMDGSLPEHQVMPGATLRLRVRRRAVRRAPLSLPRRPAEAAHPQGALRRCSSSIPTDARPPADELVMVMNGFDTNFDADNEVYAVNTVAHHFMHEPIRGRGRRAGADVSRQRHRVRSDQQPAPARDVLRRLPHRHVAGARRSAPTP